MMRTILLLLVLTVASYAQSLDGLVAHFPLNGDAIDVGGDSQHGTISDALESADRFGNESGSMEFDGANDRITFPSLGIFQATHSVNFWVFLNSNNPAYLFYPGGEAYIFVSYNSPDLSGSSADNLSLVIRDSGSNFHFIESDAIELNQWTNVSYIYDSTDGMYLYINGQLEASSSSTVPPKTLSNSNTLGNYRSTAADYCLDGKLDDVRIYDRALTIEEILQLTHEGGFDPTLIADYPFNGNAIDESGNGNNAVDVAATLIADRFDQPESAYRFNGTNQYIEFEQNSQFDDLEDFTISVFVFRETSNFILNRWSDELTDNPSFMLGIDGTNDKVSSSIYDGSNSSLLYSNSDIPINQWSHITYVKDGENLLLYLNGQLDASTTTTILAQNTDLPLMVGKQSSGGGQFGGRIDDIGFYRRALSADEVDSLYHEGGWGQDAIRLVPAEYSTIQSAIDASTDGDTVLVYPGTYLENINFDYKSIVLGSLTLMTGDTTHISRTIVDGGELTTVINVTGVSTKVVGISIRNGLANTGAGLKINSNTSIENCYIFGNSASQPGSNPTGGGVIIESGNVCIKNSVIHSNEAGDWGGGISAYAIQSSDSIRIVNCDIWGNTSSRGAGIYSRGSSKVYIEQCKIHDNTAGDGGGICAETTTGQGKTVIENSLIYDNNIGNESANRGGGISIFNGSNAQVINSTVTNNFSQNGAGLDAWDNSRTLIMNTIIYDNGGSNVNLTNNTDGPLSFTALNSIIEGGLPALSGVEIADTMLWSPTVMDTDPLFADAANKNFSINAGSVCISRGRSSVGYFNKTISSPRLDLTGLNRPMPLGSNSDIGAFENQTALPDTTFIPGGGITTDSTWSLPGSPYVLTGDLYIEVGGSLTIEPGVQVLFDRTDEDYETSYAGQAEIWVRGTLSAVGTETDSILFDDIFHEYDQVGGSGWANIRFQDDPSHPTIGIFKYVQIKNATKHGLWVSRSDSLIVEHCSFENNFEDIVCGDAIGYSTFEPIRIEHNQFRNSVSSSINYNNLFGALQIRFNEFECSDNAPAFVTYGTGDSGLDISYNNVLQASNDFSLIHHYGDYGIEARLNYWGPATTSEMSAGSELRNISTIYDYFDDNSLGTVNYSHFLDTPWPEGSPVFPDTTYISGGQITEDSTWSLAESPFMIQGDVIINATLTIEPGVEIYFDGYRTFDVHSGFLSAIGTVDDSIYFLPYQENPDGGAWQGIRGNSANVGSLGDFDYCVINNAQFGIWGVTANIYVTNSQFINCGEAIFADADADSIKIGFCSFQNSRNRTIYTSQANYLEVTNSVFTQDDDKAQLYFDYVPDHFISENNFHCISAINNYAEDDKDIDVRFNYWGTSGTAEILSGENPRNLTIFYDSFDNPVKGTVNYSHWLDAPYPDGQPVGNTYSAEFLISNNQFEDAMFTYHTGDSIFFQVTDIDRDANASSAEQINILVRSETETAGESVTLTETGNDTQTFQGFVKLDESSATTDGLLQVTHGDWMYFQYVDPEDDWGNPETISSRILFNATIIPESNLSVSQIWERASSPYIVTGEITVPDNITLTIEPGVSLFFDVESKPNINIGATSHLYALGTETDSITFEPYQNPDSYWGQLVGSQLFFEYCYLKNCDYVSSNDSLEFKHSTLINSNYMYNFEIFGEYTRIQNSKILNENAENAAILLVPNHKEFYLLDSEISGWNQGIYVGHGASEEMANSLISIHRNTFSGNNEDLLFVNNAIVNAAYNNLLSPLKANVHPGFSVDINLKNNYWGTAATVEMSAGSELRNISGIQDYFDNNSLGTVDYSQFLNAPWPGGSPVFPDTTYITGGSITQDSTWTLALSPYVISGDVLVDNGATLTIQPGVEVLFASERDDQNGGRYPELAELYIQNSGKIIAVGTETDSIFFHLDSTEQVEWKWGVIGIEQGSHLAYCDIQGAVQVMVGGDSDVIVEHSKIYNTTLPILIDGGTPSIYDNYLASGFWSLWMNNSPGISIQRNTMDGRFHIEGDSETSNVFHNNFINSYGTEVVYLFTRDSINLFNNYFGVSATAEMSASPDLQDVSLIHDYFDDDTLGLVDYSEFLDAPWPQGRPVYPDTTYITGGTITLDSIWTLSQSPYLISGDVVLQNDATLTIEPGVEVLFVPNMNDQPYTGNEDYFYLNPSLCGIVVSDGHLNAIGTEADSIIFRSKDVLGTNEDWQGITLADSLNNLEFVLLRDCYRAINAMSAPGNGFNVSNSRFTNIRQNAIYYGANRTSAVITNNHFNNLNVGIAAEHWADGTISNNQIYNCLTGVHFRYQPQVSFKNNDVYENDRGITLHINSNYDAEIKFNNIYNNSVYDVEFEEHPGDNRIYSVDMQNNFWGEEITGEFESGANPKDITSIYDWFDNEERATIDYSHWLDAPWPNGQPIGNTYSSEFLVSNNQFHDAMLTYHSGDSIFFQVSDIDRNTNASAIEQITLLVSSETETTEESVTLTETGNDTHIFQGFIKLDESSATSDGLLHVAHGDWMHFQYIDPADDYGNVDTLDRKLVYDATVLPQASYTTPTTFDYEHSPYLVTGNIDFTDELTIEPGVKLYFLDDVSLSQQSTAGITAVGTELDSIHFSSYLSAHELMSWPGILLKTGLFRYCVISNGRDAISNNGATTDTIRIENSSFEYCHNPLKLSNNNTNVRVENTSFVSCNAAIFTSGEVEISNSTFITSNVSTPWSWHNSAISIGETADVTLTECEFYNHDLPSYPSVAVIPNYEGLFTCNNSNFHGIPVAVDLNETIHQTLNFRYNYWGVEASAEMSVGPELRQVTTILDYFDESTMGMVDYSQFLDAPWPSGQPVFPDTTYISGGTITQDSTWTLALSPYVISGDVVIDNGATLTVEPGVEIYFTPNSDVNNLRYEPNAVEISVWDGYLYAVGTETDSIFFRSHASESNPYDWGEINFSGNGQPGGYGSIQYCVISGARYGLLIDHVSAESFNLSHNNISNCDFGMYLVNSHGTIAHNRISNTTADAILFGHEGTSENYTIEYNEISGAPYGLGIHGGHESALVIRNNNFSNIWQHSIHLANNAPTEIYSNNFPDSGYDIFNDTSIDRVCMGNYWGSQTTIEMESGDNPKNIISINDSYDDSNLGVVNYSHWLDAPWPEGQPVGNTYSAELRITNYEFQEDMLTYHSGDSVFIQITDIDRNTDDIVPNQISLDVWSELESSPETITLTETDLASAVFQGFIKLDDLTGASFPDGQLQVSHGDWMYFQYIDPADDWGNTDTTFAQKLFDATIHEGGYYQDSTYTLTADGSPYILTEDMVFVNGHFIIEPGTAVYTENLDTQSYDPNSAGRVSICIGLNSSMNAQGTESDSVLIASYDREVDWYGIRIHVVSQPLHTKIQYASISNAIYGSWFQGNGNEQAYDSLTVTNSSYYDCGGGIVIHSQAEVSIENNSFSNCGFSGSGHQDAEGAIVVNAHNSGSEIFIGENLFHETIAAGNGMISLRSADVVNIIGNTFNAGYPAIKIQSVGDFTINFNNFNFDNTGWGQIDHESTSNADFRFNYWGVDGTDEILSATNPQNLWFIEDGYDSPSFGLINYSRWLNAPWPDGTPAPGGYTGELELTYSDGTPAWGYNQGDTLFVQIYDPDLNLNVNTPETAQIEVRSELESNPELLTLNEVTADSGVFTGWMLFDDQQGFPMADGVLQVDQGNWIFVQYTDAVDDWNHINTNLEDSIVYNPRIRDYESDANTIGLLHFDEGSGQILHDVSTYENHCYLGNNSDIEEVDPEWINGISYNALEYDGAAIVKTNVRPTRPMTIEAWVYPYNTMGLNSIISNDDHGHWGDGIVIQDGTFGVMVEGVGGISSSFEANSREWYHVSAVFTTEDIKLYVNNNMVQTYDYQTEAFVEMDSYFRIGSVDGIDHAFEGIIDEVRISNIARTSFDYEYSETLPGKSNDLTIADSTSNSISLAWYAPGADNYTGTATVYDLRMSSSPIDSANFDLAIPVADAPLPERAGTLQSMQITGLDYNSTYYFAIKAQDDEGLWSPISNIALGHTEAQDFTPPGTITDLSVGDTGKRFAVLSWTAPADDGSSGRNVQGYSIHYSLEPITSENFWSTDSTQQLINSTTPGGAVSDTVPGLDPNSSYYFAVKAFDEVPNYGDLSNTPQGNTQIVPIVASTPFPMNGYGRLRSRNAPHLGATQGTFRWNYATDGAISSSPVLDESGNVYFGSEDGSIYALDPAGDLLWEKALGAGVFAAPTVGTENHLFVASKDNKIYALNITTGDTLWSYTTGNQVFSSPVVSSFGYLYVGSLDNKVYALSSDNGELLWSFTGSNRFYAAPALNLNETEVVIGDQSGNVYGLNARTGTQEWSYATGTGIYANAAIDSAGNVYVGAQNGNLYALDASGDYLWDYATGGAIFYASPTIGYAGIAMRNVTEYSAKRTPKPPLVEGALFAEDSEFSAQGSTDNPRSIANTKSQVQLARSTTKNPTSPVSIFKFQPAPPNPHLLTSNPLSGSAATTIYIGSDAQSLHAVDAVMGTELWTFPTDGQIRNGALLSANGFLYFGSANDSVYCISESGARRWVYGTEGAVYTSNPAMALDGSIYIGSYDNSLYAVGEYLEIVDPVIVSTYPPVNSAIAPVDTTIEIKFNTILNMFTVDESSVNISGNFQGSHSCTYEWRGSDSTLLITPGQDFFYGEKISVFLSTTLQSVSAGVGTDFRFSFTASTLDNTEPMHATPTWSSSNSGINTDIKFIRIDDDEYIDMVAISGHGNLTKMDIYINAGGYFNQEAAYSIPLYNNNPNNSNMMRIVDIDNDGDSDISVYNQEVAGIEIYKNNGGYISQTSSQTIPSQHFDFAWGYLNNDEYPDLAAVNENQNLIYLNTTGVVETSASWTGSQNNHQGSGLEWVDYDNDGDQDIIFGNELFENNDGSIGYVVYQFTLNSNNTNKVVIANIDADPFPEIAFASGLHNDSYNSVWDYDGVSSFDRVWATNFSESMELQFVDVDGDSDLDLFLGTKYDEKENYYPRPDYIFLNNSGVIEDNPSWATDAVTYTYRSDWADIENDGDMDLVIASAYAGSEPISIFGNGIVSEDMPPQLIRANPTDGALAIDNDLALELWIRPTLDLGSINSGILLNGSLSGSFDYAYEYEEYSGKISIQPIGMYEFGETLSLNINNQLLNINGIQNNNLAENLSIIVESSNLNSYLDNTPTWSSSNSGINTDIKFIRIDADEYIDIVAISGHGNLTKMDIYINAGGYFNQEAAYSIPLYNNNPNNSNMMRIVDIDNDGDSDISVYNQEVAGIEIYKNNGGYISQTSSQTIPSQHFDFAWGYLNNDEYPDLAAVNANQNLIYLNTTGVVETSASWTGSQNNHQGSGLEWVDYDNDGDQDIIFGNELFENNSGSIGSVVYQFTLNSNNTNKVVIANIDADPFPEIAFASGLHNDSYNSVWDYDGVSSFDRVWATNFSESMELQFVDVDGDSDLDLFLGTKYDEKENYFPRPDYIFLNNSGVIEDNPSWATDAVTYTYRGDWADIENDGDMDLVIASAYAGSEPINIYGNHQEWRFNVSLTSMNQDDYSGTVQIPFEIENPGGNPTSLACAISTDGGSNWFNPSTSTDTTDLSAANYSGSLDWNSIADGYDHQDIENVLVALTPHDGVNVGRSDTISFHLDNNALPIVAMDAISGEQSAQILVSYTLSDSESDVLALTGSYQLVGDAEWTIATLSGSMTDLTSETGTLTWDTEADLPQASGLYALRLIASDLDAGNPDILNIQVDNYHGQSIVLSINESPVRDTLAIEFTITDITSDTLDLICRYALGGNGGQELASRSTETVMLSLSKQDGILVQETSARSIGVEASTVALRRAQGDDNADTFAGDKEDEYARAMARTRSYEYAEAFVKGERSVILSPSKDDTSSKPDNTKSQRLLRQAQDDETVGTQGGYSILTETNDWFQPYIVGDTVQLDPSSYSGTLYWYSHYNLPETDIDSVYLSIVPSDGWATGGGDTLVLVVDNNRSPVVAISDIVGEQRNDITIPITLSDTENDLIDLSVSYKREFEPIWHTDPTLSGSLLGLSSGDHQLIWQSSLDLANYVGNAYFRITPSDNDPGTAVSILLNIDQIDAPAISLDLEAQEEYSGDIPISYLLEDGGADTVALSIEYQTSTTAWQSASILEDVSALDSSLYSGSFTWQSSVDLDGMDDENVQLRTTPADDNAGPTYELPAFHLDNNDIPGVDVLDLVGVQSDSINIDLVLDDTEGDSLSILVEYMVETADLAASLTRISNLRSLVETTPAISELRKETTGSRNPGSKRTTKTLATAWSSGQDNILLTENSALREWGDATVLGTLTGIPAEDYSTELTWLSSTDLPMFYGDVKIRISPSDLDLGNVDSTVILVDNIVAAVTLGEITTEVSDLVTFDYNIINSGENPVSLLIQYSTDAGANWNSASITENTIDLTVDAYSGSLTWNSTDDLDHWDGMVRLRATPIENQTGMSDEIADFNLDNNRVPGVEISDLVGVQLEDIDIEYTLSDAETDSLAFLVEYHMDESWLPATILGDSSRLHSEDYAGSFSWISQTDLPDQYGEVLLRLTPYDLDYGNSDTITVFVDNVVSTVQLVDPVGENTHDVLVGFTVENDGFNPVGLDVEYSSDGTEWFSAQVQENLSSVDSANYAGSFTWQSWDNLAHWQGAVELRVTPNENQVGQTSTTAAFQLDNNLPPTIQLTPVVGILTQDIALDYTLGDSENDSLGFMASYRPADSTEWRAATVSGDTSSILAEQYQGILNWSSYNDVPDLQGTVEFRLLPYDLDLGQGDTIQLDLDNVLPVASLTDLDSEVSQQVSFDYEITNIPGNALGLLVEYSLDGNTWLNASITGDTSGIGTDNYVGTLIWDSWTDVPNYETTSAQLRLTPYDTYLGIADMTTSFHLDNNLLPSIIFGEIQGEMSDVVALPLSFADAEDDTLFLTAEYSLDLTEWTSTSVGISTLNPGTYPDTLLWTSTPALEGVDQDEVYLRIQVADLDPGVTDTISFHLDNNRPPTAELQLDAGEYSGDISSSYTISDNESDNLSYALLYSLDSVEWLSPNLESTELNEGTVEFTWLSDQDIDRQDIQTVHIRVDVADADPGLSVFQTIHIDNHHGEIALTVPEGEQSGLIDIELDLNDPALDELRVKWEYLLPGESTWIPVTGITDSIFSSENYSDTVGFVSEADLAGIDLPEISLRASVRDEWGSGDTAIVLLDIDNQIAPQVLSHFPEAGSLVSWSDPIWVDFTQFMDLDISADQISLHSQDGSVIAADVVVDSSNLFIQPSASLPSYDSITVVLEGSLSNSQGVGLDGSLNGDPDGAPVDDYSWSYLTGLAGDFDLSGSIDILDAGDFTAAWMAQSSENSDVYELSPSTGTNPALTIQPDGVLDVSDLARFVYMWNWSFDNGLNSTLLAKKQWNDSESSFIDITSNYEGQAQWNVDYGEHLTLDLALNDALDPRVLEVVLQYDPALLVFERTNYLSDGNRGSETIELTLHDSTRGLIVLNMINMSQKAVADVESAFAQVCFTPLGDETTTIQVQSRSIAVGADRDQVLTRGGAFEFATQPVLPEAYVLHNNFPNPFNAGTTLRYELPESADVRMSIFDIRGREVISLVDETQEAGYKSLEWRGLNQTGEPVSSGVYFCVLQANSFRRVEKMVLLK